MPRPSSGRRVRTFRVDPDLWDEFVNLSKAMDKTAADQVREFVEVQVPRLREAVKRKAKK